MSRIFKKSVKKELEEELICPPSEAFRLYRRALALWGRKAGRMFWLAGLHALVKAVNSCCTLYLTARLLNEIAGLRRREELFKWTLAILMITVLLSLIQALLFHAKEVYESALNNYTGEIYVNKMLDLDFSILDDPKTYEQFSQIKQAEFYFGQGLLRVYWHFGWLLEELFKILGAVALSVSLFIMKVPPSSGRLTVLNSPVCILFAVLCILGASFGSTVLDKRILEHENQLEKGENFANRWWFWILGFATEQKRGIDIRLYEQEKNSIASFRSTAYKKLLDPMAEYYRGKGGLMRALSALFPCLLTGLIYLFVCLKAWAGAFGIGMITQYIGAATSLFGGLLGLMEGLTQARANAFHLRELFRFLDIPNEMYQGSLTVEKRSDRKYEIEFRDVSFRYPGSESYVLSHVSMKFQIGRRLAVVGQNGSGKTTFIKLLCRLYDPTEGVILLNGIDIRKYNYQEYLSIFSVVFQDYQLLSLSLAENVAVSGDYDQERVMQCIEKAGLSEMLSKLPKGLSTCIGKDYEEEGIQVSGGQGQKIAIARSLYKDASFMILDEPTAALDPVAEYEIYTRFNEIIGDRTAVYISHRLSSCRFCDEIIVFHEGKVVQQGSHDKLLSEEDGKYVRLWEAQAQYYT